MYDNIFSVFFAKLSIYFNVTKKYNIKFRKYQIYVNECLDKKEFANKC